MNAGKVKYDAGTRSRGHSLRLFQFSVKYSLHLSYSRFAYGYLVGNTSSIALAEASLEL